MEGSPTAAIDSAADEVRSVLIAAASRNRCVTYGELARQVHSLEVEPHSQLLSELLARVTLAEYTAGHPLLTSIVVRKEGEPGHGFFKLAHRLGYEFTDPMEFWVHELTAVFAFHGNGRAAPSRRRPVMSQTPARRDRTFTVEDLLQYFDF